MASPMDQSVKLLKTKARLPKLLANLEQLDAFITSLKEHVKSRCNAQDLKVNPGKPEPARLQEATNTIFAKAEALQSARQSLVIFIAKATPGDVKNGEKQDEFMILQRLAYEHLECLCIEIQSFAREIDRSARKPATCKCQYSLNYIDISNPEDFGLDPVLLTHIGELEMSSRRLFCLISQHRQVILSLMEEQDAPTLAADFLPMIQKMANKVLNVSSSSISHAACQQLRKDAIRDYRSAEDCDAGMLWCPVLKDKFEKREMVCGHIIKADSARPAAAILGMSVIDADSIMTSVPNTIMWHERVQELCIQGKCVITTTDKPNEFAFHLLDRSLANEYVFKRERTFGTWADVEKKPLDFRNATARPSKRHLYVQTLVHTLIAKRRGYEGWELFEDKCLQKEAWASPGKYVAMGFISALAYNYGLPNMTKWTKEASIFDRHSENSLTMAFPRTPFQVDPHKTRMWLGYLVEAIDRLPLGTHWTGYDDEQTNHDDTC